MARLFIRDYEFCIFDELTAGLDRENTLLIEKEIFDKFKGFIYITHHYSKELVVKFDEVIFIDKINGVKIYEPNNFLKLFPIS